jgi:alpha-beta hydrolase superfamily lysophospholipase
MGAMMAQQYLYRFGASLKGAVLSGSPGHMPALISLTGQAIATIDTWRFDPAAPSPWLSENLFRTNNRPFEKAGNGNGGFAWLSRDEQEVMRYREDPLCGAILNAAGLKGMFDGLKKSTQKANIDCINKQIPILIISGEKDPVHNSGKGIRVLAKRYRQTGLKVTSKIYPGGRHEMFNEINREEVYKDLLQWLSEIGYD